ncbi:disks large-associated protein 5 [Hyla sarda]|uniref:disks large-associated protein 5 n=1 Tax=Hyla sarda TaxID=327740 RepID=UPI0024C25F2C|nr:disks large-associated protein 5 [Hyla sarda]XP_056401451.1 disks large-associated protein 5 [Hyla sarda]
MDIPSQFASRYKKDMSIENLRAKVARRKSITQKENRHKEFKRSRGLSLADVNVSLMREQQDLTVVEEANESSLVNGLECKSANQCKTKELILQEERRMKLQRYKEEKQLRKLKEQREKAGKVFKCGTYKPEVSFIPILTTQTAAKVKQKEKPPAPSVTRVTRSTVKTEPPAKETRTRAIPVKVLNSDAPVNRAGTKVRGQTSVVKKNERENKVSAIPSTRTTRSGASAVSKIPSVSKVVPKNSAAAKPQKPTRDISPEMVIDKNEPPVIDQSNDKEPESEPIHKDTCVESESVPETSPVKHERKPSFAPHNFVFQPLDGLSTFTFQPMTPNRANAFLTPTFTFSPLDSRRNFVVTREHNAEDQETVMSPTEPSPTTTEGKLEVSLNASTQNEEHTSHANCAPQASPALAPPPCEPTAEDVTTTLVEQPSHDVPYFRNTLKSEIQRLTLLCIDWDKRIDMDIPEDAKDLIRTTVGQTRLLISERFKQFEGLVDNCEFKRGEKETTCTDLDGFWDMIYFQIEDVIKKFANLAKLEENSWQQNTVQPKKVVRKKIAPVVTGKQNQGDNGRAAARSRLASIKAAMKNRVKVEEFVVEGDAPVLPMQVDPVVFDAGFFRIESPAKLPGSLRKNLSSSQTNTPTSTKKVSRNLGTPVANGIEEPAQDCKPEESSSPEKLPVRKALFGIPQEDSLQNQEPDPMMQCPEPTETDSVPAVADLAKYLVQTHAISLTIEESPGLVKCLGLEESEIQSDSDTEAAVDTSVTDDVFMCSPEKVKPTTEPSSSLETSEVVPDDPMCPLQPSLMLCPDVNTTSDPLDFLGSGTPIMAVHSPMRVEPDAALTDLIMFSPMEN